MGRPKLEINFEQLEQILRFNPRAEDVAAFFRVSKDTLERRIREEYDLTFIELREQEMVHTRVQLVQRALGKALDGDNLMLIFCLKNLCGWGDGPKDGAVIDIPSSRIHVVGKTTEPDTEPIPISNKPA